VPSQCVEAAVIVNGKIEGYEINKKYRQIIRDKDFMEPLFVESNSFNFAR
jgi:hypothetical protein